MEEASSPESKLCENLESWMTDLPSVLRNTPIVHLAIPGSHDSFTSSIRSTSRISPDAGELLERLTCLGPIAGIIISRWVKTQEYTVVKQLNAGIRYFDLRISTKDGTEQLFFVHGQYSDDVVSVLNEIENFLDAHEKEVVILDCQHFYDFISRDHERLMRLLKATFGPKIVTTNYALQELTLDFITEYCKCQVIIIYRSKEAAKQHLFFWPSSDFPTPWPETTNPNELITFLNEGLRKRGFYAPHISQFVLTPTKSYICRKLLSTLKTQCVLPLEKVKYNWLSQQSPGPFGLNIVICDFVDINQSKFSKDVISLNEKLIDKSPRKE